MSINYLYTEAELLGRLKLGEERAFEELYVIYSPLLYKKLLRLVKDEAIAQELLQDLFVRIWEKRSQIDAEKSFRAYLFRITQNLVTDFYRRVAFDKKMIEVFVRESTEYVYAFEDELQDERRQILMKAMDTLSPKRKEIYMLIKLERKSYEEVGELLGISVSTISDHVVKATKTLKEYISKNDTALIALIAVTLTSI
ncbi:RNA polymerase sigma factor [Pedobacter frigoris]|uniref:RNA polymerase sigma factor n=1 Tax=Pedobacter frigoris TaxID=2571272 RepID=UPI00292FCFEE|nr:sigma-70 family RNA polymerase sigma factor [Pedobacter frigoris]